MPVQYAGIVAEHRAVREQAGLFDVSHMGRLEVTGPGALAAVNRLITNDLVRIADGRAVYACCCRPDGGILDDVIVYRHSMERIVVVCNASNHDKILAHLQNELAGRAFLEDQSESTGLIALQGPSAVRLIEHLTNSGISSLPRFHFASVSFAGAQVVVARTGYTGEDGVELFVPAESLVNCWTMLLEEGHSDGVAPIGLGARDTLRLEACLPLYGHEIDETIHPLEAGIGFAVKLDKPDFIGLAALQRAKAATPSRRLVGLRMTGRGVAREGYPIINEDGKRLGHVTSGAPSPTLGQAIALAYVPVALANIGTPITVDCRGKSVSAEVVKTPFCKRV